MLLLARIIRIITAVVVLIIVAGILLKVLDANTGNVLVSAILDAANWLVTPFKKIFSLDSENLTTIVNWGLAAIVYAIIGGLIASLIARAGIAARGRSGRRRDATA